MIILLSMIDEPAEQARFAAIYRKYYGLMYHVAYKLLNNHEDAEDAVQQSFLSIIHHLHKLKDSDSPETRSYLVIIAERKSIDILRAKSKVNLLEYKDEITGLHIPTPGDAGLADAIVQLPPMQRQVLLLRYDNGFTTAEIAKMFGITPSGVRKLLARSKKALATILAQGGADL